MPSPQDTVDRPLKAVHGLHHELQTRIEQAFGLFGVKPLHDVHRASDIAEQNGHDFALALKRGPARQDTLSQMVRRIVKRSRAAPRGVRVQEGGRGRVNAVQGRPAGPTKLFPSRHLAAATRAGQAEACAAFFAELNPVPIGGLACAALHSLASASGSESVLRGSRID